MKVFGYFYKNDPKKEIIGLCKSVEDIDQAIEYFASIKRISIDDFLNLYTTVNLNNND